MNNETVMKIGLAQIAPVWLDRNATIEKISDWVQQAAEAGCRLVAFGETLLPGYPFWLSNTDGARFESDIQKDIHAHYLRQAVDIERGDLGRLSAVARKHHIEIMVGCYERPRDRGHHTGFASLVRICSEGQIRNVHRKLVPTYEERLSWGAGDGHGLTVFPLGSFTVGGLNCWENWMPLARAALYAQGEDLHVAVWPGSRQNTEDITRFVAKESRSFVLSVSGLLTRDNIPDDFPHRDVLLAQCPETMAGGGSCAAGPDGAWIVEPVDSSEQLVVVEVDHQDVLRERQNFDPSGHYSRPDVTQLIVNRRRQTVLRLDDGDEVC